MKTKQVIQQFEQCHVRTAWNSDHGKWYFSVVDVVAALTDSKNPAEYLKKLRKREPELAQGWGQIVTPLTMDSTGGPQKTNCADREGIFHIIQFISSPKAEQFKQWLEQLSAESEQYDSFEQLPDIERPHGEIVLYQPDETTRMEVRLENETVWLTQAQMVELFQTTRNNIALHIGNVFREGELQEKSVGKDSLLTAADGKHYRTKLYNLDVIISVGYRVKSQRGIRFRQWANSVIKNYLLRGYAINQQLLHVEQRIDAKLDAQQRQIQKIESTLADHQEKIDFFVRTNQSPVEGVLYEGQIFDALYHFGASFKDLGKRLFAFERMGIEKSIILNQL